MESSNTPDEHILDATVTVPDHVVYRAFEAETLLLNLESGQYHGLNGTGGRMLEMLKESGGTVRDTVRALAEEYGVDGEEIEPDMAEFCRALVDRGLVELTSAEPDGAVG